jgi:hypothetical protein
MTLSTIGMNDVVAVTITLLRPSGRPSTQRIWVVTCDLSINGVMPHHRFLRRNWFCDYTYWRSMKFDFSSCAHCSKLWRCLAQFETHVHSMMHLPGGQASWAVSCACIWMWNQLESSSVVGSSNTCFCGITFLKKSN